MKKLICVMLMVVVLGSMLAGCFTCDFCEESKLITSKNSETYEGQEFVYCDDCKEELEEFADAMNDLADLYDYGY